MKQAAKWLLAGLFTILAICPAYAGTEGIDFSHLFQEHGSVMLIIDVDSGAILDANQAAVTFYGYPRETLLLLNINQINTLSSAEVEQEMQAAAAENRNYFLFSHRLASGEIRSVEVYSYPFVKDGKTLLYSIVHDISAKKHLEEALRTRTLLLDITLLAFLILQFTAILLLARSLRLNKKTQKELRESKEKYQALFDNMEEAFALHEILCDQEGKPVDYRFLGVNRAFESITGLKGEDIINKTVLEVLPETEAYWIANYGEVALTGKSMHFENYSRELGRSFFVNVFSPVKGRFATIFFDISESKRFEKALYEEKERLRTTLSSVGDGVISTDRNGRIDMLNDVAQILTGWSQDDAHGKSFEEVFAITSEITGERCDDPVRKVLETGAVIALEDRTLLTSRDGTQRSIADSAAPIRDNEGAIQGVVIVFRDVTGERTRQEEILYLSYHDPLTGLYNRRFFEVEAKRLDTERQLPISIILGDVNGLKLVNDVFGHFEGDKLLRSASQVMKAACRNEDIIARWGGDEFIAILPHTSEEEVEAICRRIKEQCSREEEGPVKTSISLGYATKEESGQDLHQVIKRAEDNMYRHKVLESRSLRSAVVNSIKNTLHEKSHETEAHAYRIKELCRQTGSCMGLQEIDLFELELLAVLHDIGKIAISDAILSKPGKLNEEEWQEMKRHPEIGYRIAQSAPELSHVAEYILTHHECWDGSGYPRSLKGEEIPLVSRILAVVDAFDAMTNERPYRNPLSVQAAVEELLKHAGSQFDPRVVGMFIKNVIQVEGGKEHDG